MNDAASDVSPVKLLFFTSCIYFFGKHSRQALGWAGGFERDHLFEAGWQAKIPGQHVSILQESKVVVGRHIPTARDRAVATERKVARMLR